MYMCEYVAVSTPTSNIQIPSAHVLLPTSALHPQPSQPPAASTGVSVGGAIAALLILAVFAAAGVTIVIVVLVRRHNLQKLTNSTCTFTPCDLDDIQGDHPPVLGQSAE